MKNIFIDKNIKRLFLQGHNAQRYVPNITSSLPSLLSLSRIDLLTKSELNLALDQRKKLHCYIVGKVTYLCATAIDKYSCLFTLPQNAIGELPFGKRILMYSMQSLSTCAIQMDKDCLVNLFEKKQITMLSTARLVRNNNKSSSPVGLIKKSQDIHIVKNKNTNRVFLRTDRNEASADNLGELPTDIYSLFTLNM